MFVLKLNYDGDTRRATFLNESKPDYVFLEKHIREVFADSLQTDRNFKLKYLDDEGDAISVSCEHDLREAFLFCQSAGRSSLRMNILPIDKPVAETNDGEGTDKARSEEWSARVQTLRGKFKSFVDVVQKYRSEVQKFGELIQKKLEERKTEANSTEDCPTTAETAPKEDCQQQQINCDGTEPQIDEPEKEREKEKEAEQEKESEREKEKEPEHCEVKVSIAVSQAIAAPVPLQATNEWKEMLKLYELTAQERAELSERMRKAGTN